jgi:RimJ/RimL family protein N-acetyltransferase
MFNPTDASPSDLSQHQRIGEHVNSNPAPYPERTTIEGRMVSIEPLNPARHGGELYEATCGAAQEDLWLYLGSGPFSDRSSFDSYLQSMSVSEDPLVFALVDRASGKAVGHAAYLRIVPAHRVIEVGNILYAPQFQRTAGATEAMYLMARYAFETLGYRRYEWKCNALNAPSRKAALRFGFTFEGIFRQHMIVKGRNRDTAWFSMLDGEWPARKKAFEAWLDPSNFDSAGRQIASLAGIRKEIERAAT